jgi:flagellar biosynthetic protein FlhB
LARPFGDGGLALTIELAVIGGLILSWQLFSMTKNLRMSKPEVKDEMKQPQDSSKVNGQIRRRKIETSQRGAIQRAALACVPEATAIITIPTHFAVALKYDARQKGAPTLMATGKGSLAAEINRRAIDLRVRVMYIPMLARAPYFADDIGAKISRDLHTAVATILAHFYRLNRGEASAQPNLSLPPDLQFD